MVCPICGKSVSANDENGLTIYRCQCGFDWIPPTAPLKMPISDNYFGSFGINLEI